jgi:hypothetical protein
MFRLFGIVLCTMMTLGIFAKEVPVNIAKQVSNNFFISNYSNFHDNSLKSFNNPTVHVKNLNGNPAYYIFNYDTDGFVIVSGDDAVEPILGFSYEGGFDHNNIAPALQNWFEGTLSHIQSARTQNKAASSKVSKEWNKYLSNNLKIGGPSKDKIVTPLLSSKWNQDNPYNDSCPPHSMGPSGKCYAGCVATTMGQVMYYHRYPPQGTGTYSYYHPHFMNLSANFGNTTYEWGSMTNIINNNSRSHIAQLLVQCGISVDMNYSPYGSSATLSKALLAMKQHFSYSSRARLYEMGDYPDSIWHMMIKDNLELDIPLLYRGTGTQGGHAFVCDGYYNNNRFHFNWGWSGSNDGFFFLDNMSFSMGQAAIFDMVPYDYPYCGPTRTLTETNRYFEDGSGYSKYWNNTDCEWLIAPENNLPITLTFSKFKTESGKDILHIYDGSSANTTLIGSYSGHSLPPVIQSTGNKLFLKFVTDGNHNDMGFEAFYTSIPAGINHNENDHQFSVYPNPATNKLTIEFNEPTTKSGTLNLISIDGKIVLSREFQSNEKQLIDVSNISNGVYLLNIRTENGVSNQKVVIK